MPALLTSIIRTLVPWLVGLALGLLAKVGLEGYVDVDELGAWFELAIAAAYYAAVRWLEQQDPRWGWLIGYATAPTYPTPAEAAAGLMPVPAAEVVAVKDPTVPGLPGETPAVAGPGSALPDGTPVHVTPA